MECKRLDTRLGPLAWRSSGSGPPIVFFAGALANGDLWRDVVVALEDRYRCITIDLPLGAHPWPLSPGADRSDTSAARRGRCHGGRERHGRRTAPAVARQWSSGARASGPSRPDEL